MTWRARAQVASISVFVGVCLLAGLVQVRLQWACARRSSQPASRSSKAVLRLTSCVPGVRPAVIVCQGPWRTELESRPPMPDVPHSKSHAVQGQRKANRQIKLKSSAPEPPMPLVNGKLFHGWLKPAGKDSARGNAVAATGGSDKDEDQGGETWWAREHLAAPPAGWHAPDSKKAKSVKKARSAPSKMHMLAKQEPKEEPNEFHGKGADASPETIEHEIKKGLKPFGNGKDLEVESDGEMKTMAQKGIANKPKTIAEKIQASLEGKKPAVTTARMTTSIAQELHREHRHIASTLVG